MCLIYVFTFVFRSDLAFLPSPDTLPTPLRLLWHRGMLMLLPSVGLTSPTLTSLSVWLTIGPKQHCLRENTTTRPSPTARATSCQSTSPVCEYLTGFENDWHRVLRDLFILDLVVRSHNKAKERRLMCAQPEIRNVRDKPSITRHASLFHPSHTMSTLGPLAASVA